MAEQRFDPQAHMRKIRTRQGMQDARRRPFTEEHKAKISAALKAHHASSDSHLPSLHEAMRGEDHPNFRNGTNAAYYRRIAFEMYGERCQRCGSDRNINIHHKDEDRSHYDVSNLEVLCRSCHNKAHKLGGRNGRHEEV